MANLFEKIWKIFKTQVQQDLDSIFGLTYNVWLINTGIDAKLYLWENWKLLYPEIDSLLRISSPNGYIRTFQSFEFENKWLGFGRMIWNEKNNKLWCLKYRSNENLDKKLQFSSTEVWAPDWNFCYKKGITPEIYIRLYEAKLDIINEGLVIAIPKRITKKNYDLVHSKIESLQQHIPSSTISKIERYWTPSKGFINRIEDMNPHEMKKMKIGRTK